MPTISAAIIALNEADHVRELLASLACVDEVVLLDGGSDDATVRLAQVGGARVFSRPFDDFATQREAARRLCRGDWVLSIDADERVTPALARRIAPAARQTRFAAFRVPISSTIFGRPVRYGGTQDDRPIRLFRRDAAHWTGHVHEVLEVDGRVGRLHEPLTHRTYPDLESFLTKMHRYTRLQARERVAIGRAPRAWDRWVAPPREVFRRLLYKAGLLDGPAGWAFGVLSGLSEWVLAREHARLWQQRAEVVDG